MLCYRPTEKHSWSDRTLYLSEDYNPYKEYNHRSLLDNEIVIEYDLEDKELNKKYVDIIRERLTKDGIIYSLWHSGNKSIHLHVLVDTKEAKNLSLLKNAFIRVYSEGLPLPDMRLIGKHLIRAEYGINEKTGVRKVRLRGSTRSLKDFSLSTIPDKVWDKYKELMVRVVKWKETNNLKDLANSDAVKLILDTVRFKEFRDGRERALFMLIHLLKGNYRSDKKGFVKYLQEWYRYSGGYKLSDSAIENKVSYHWNRDYNIGKNYILTFLDELGVDKHLYEGTTE